MITPSKILRGLAYYRRLLPVRRRPLLRTAPSPQNALETVPDLWVSRLPAPYDDVQAGEAPLFDDDRIRWAFERLGGVAGHNVLELGPLEGGHTYMAQTAGAARVTAVEMNSAAFLKCLVIKELLELDRCTFLAGDALSYMESTSERFDLCIACGILYHMVKPIQLIDLVSRCADRIVIWTHFYDRAVVAGNRRLDRRLGSAQDMSYNGFDYSAHRHSYGLDTRIAGFCGGTEAYSHWLPRADILRALEHFGWSKIETSFEDVAGSNGPSFALVASK
jgi:hypothetical protein